MTKRTLTLTIAILLGVTAAPLAADGRSTQVEELVVQERLRRSVDEAISLARSPADSRSSNEENFLNAVDKLVEIGPRTIPFLARELQSGGCEQALPGTRLPCLAQLQEDFFELAMDARKHEGLASPARGVRPEREPDREAQHGEAEDRHDPRPGAHRAQ